MTLFWIGCGLTSIGMHCHAMALAIQAAAARKRIPLEILAPRTVNARTAAALDLRLVLARSVYETNPGGSARRNDFETDVAGRRNALHKDLTRVLAHRPTSGDIVVLTTPLAPELAALADWYERLPAGNRPTLAAYCVLPIGHGIADDGSWQRAAVSSLYRDALQRLFALTEGRFQLFCENRQVLDDLSPLVPNAHLHPHIFERPPQTQPRGRPGIPYALVIGSVWASRRDKGTDLVLEMLRTDAARRTPFDWIVQVAPLHRRRPDGCDGDNMHFILNVPDHAEYWNYLAGASLVLLPYDPVAYGDGRGSGVFEEAKALGTPVLCSGAPFFVDGLSQLGAESLIFRPYSAAALFDKAVEVMATIDRHRDRFQECAQRAGQGADGFINRLLSVQNGGQEPA